jgi:rhodanese-related sulfurtransferase
MKFIKANLTWVLVVVIGIIFGAQQLQAAEGVDVAQAQSMSKQGALLLDVREVDEYAEIHAPNATLIPLGQLGTRLNEIAAYKDKPIAVICRSGRRSANVVKLLKSAGYSQVSNVSGGMIAWENAGLEVVRKP